MFCFIILAEAFRELSMKRGRWNLFVPAHFLHSDQPKYDQKDQGPMPEIGQLMRTQNHTLNITSTSMRGQPLCITCAKTLKRNGWPELEFQIVPIKSNMWQIVADQARDTLIMILQEPRGTYLNGVTFINGKNCMVAMKSVVKKYVVPFFVSHFSFCSALPLANNLAN